MILVIDTAYSETQSATAGIMIENWNDERAATTYITHTNKVADYESGAFYKRELPCILELIKEHKLTPDFIVIDGNVYLDNNSRAGLGKHLFDALNQKIQVLGVAKNKFETLTEDNALLRGQSKKPIYITSTLNDIEKSKAFIASMHGDYRIPTILKAVDSLCRDALETVQRKP